MRYRIRRTVNTVTSKKFENVNYLSFSIENKNPSLDTKQFQGRELSIHYSPMQEPKRFVHRNLNNAERELFVGTYRDVEKNDLVFRFIRQSDKTMFVWFISILAFVTYSFIKTIELYQIAYFLMVSALGIIALQIIFVATHMEAHSLFLEYEQHVPGNIRLPNWVVYYYAFYHHHHTMGDNWAPFLSYHNPQGARNVAAAHWASFSMLTSRRILIVIAFGYMFPPSLAYFAGYEIGCLLLPFAHKWQHIPPEKHDIISRILFTFLEKIGLLANHDDHEAHHKHNHPTVYQDFSSSGLYAKWIDPLLNKSWDWAFYEALRTNDVPYTIIGPYIWSIERIIVIGIPAFFCIIDITKN